MSLHKNNLNLEPLVFLDVETTGTSFEEDQIIEIGCVKMDDLDEAAFFSQEMTFWSYLKPAVMVKEGSFRVHGISDQFLADKPKFSSICDNLLAFIGDRTIVAHNASFDMGFLNAELKRLSMPSLTNKVIDSLQVARRLYPGSPVGIDALISRFNMTSRGLHSARWDAEALARIYIQMIRKKDQQLFEKKELQSGNMDEIELCNMIIE